MKCTSATNSEQAILGGRAGRQDGRLSTLNQFASEEASNLTRRQSFRCLCCRLYKISCHVYALPFSFPALTILVLVFLMPPNLRNQHNQPTQTIFCSFACAFGSPHTEHTHTHTRCVCRKEYVLAHKWVYVMWNFNKVHVVMRFVRPNMNQRIQLFLVLFRRLFYIAVDKVLHSHWYTLLRYYFLIFHMADIWSVEITTRAVTATATATTLLLDRSQNENAMKPSTRFHGKATKHVKTPEDPEWRKVDKAQCKRECAKCLMWIGAAAAKNTLLHRRSVGRVYVCVNNKRILFDSA